MKKRTSRLLSILLVLCLALALLPGTALAYQMTSSGITIRYDSKNTVGISIVGQTTPLSGEGWSYEPASKTLILSGFEGEYIGFYEGTDKVDSFTLELRGSNTVSASLEFMSARSRSDASTATITGNGSIVANYVQLNSMDTVMKGGTISTHGMRILSNCSFHMIDGTLNAIGSKYGIYAECWNTEKCIFLEGGTVTAYGDYAAIWLQQQRFDNDPIPALGTDMVDFGGRTAVGGKDESDKQILSVKEVEKTVPRLAGTLYITALTSGELTSGTETEEAWREWIGAAKYAYIFGGGQTVPPTTTTVPDIPAPAGISVTVGGAVVAWTDAEPFIDANDRTMVPLRAVADAMGLDVNWNAATREASFTGSGKTITFPIDSSTARTSDGGTVTMDTAAVIVNDRTYAPIRYLAEYFGYTVDWDAGTRTVIITG